MDMEDALGGTGTAAQGDLADVVTRARAMAAAALPSASHHQLQPPPPSSSSLSAADHISCSAAMAGGQIVMNHHPYYQEDSRLAVPFEPPVDPYLLSSSSMTAARLGGYWLPLPLPPQQVAAQQISQHACYGRDMVMMSGATADVEGDDDATRSCPSPVVPAAAAHQMMKRKNDVKKVVCIPAPPVTSSRPGGGGEVIPSDLWAWRKYGQKPIKGSPYPRGYYRCSSSKGCMARKQVERSRSDPNMLVITYTAEHNHPWPMQRNVLAGYSRPNTHVPTTTNCKKKNSCRGDSTSSPSSSSKNDLDYHQHSTTNDNMMESNAAAVAYGACVIPASSCNGGIIQPPAADDQVFAELEELEPSNNNPVMNANIYSRGVAYE